MAELGRIESDGEDAVLERQRRLQRLHRRLGAQMPQKAQDQAGREAELALAVLQRSPDTIEHGFESDAALGMRLRIEEDLGPDDALRARLLEIGASQRIEVAARRAGRSRPRSRGRGTTAGCGSDRLRAAPPPTGRAGRRRSFAPARRPSPARGALDVEMQLGLREASDEGLEASVAGSRSRVQPPSPRGAALTWEARRPRPRRSSSCSSVPERHGLARRDFDRSRTGP